MESALEQLEQLRSNDLITPGEYQAKKKEILDRL
ncbi:MAG: SHOCT domain-containing protein [Chloroflexota bacterium]